MSKNKKTIFAVMFLFFGLFVVAQAATTNLSFPLPRVCPIEGECPTNAGASIAAYLVRLYQLSVGIAGILAVGMIVAGSIYISVSGGSPDKQTEGKEMIMSAIWGLALLLGSYVILKTVNPQLVILQDPTVMIASSTPLGSLATGPLTPCPEHPSDSFCFYSPIHTTGFSYIGLGDDIKFLIDHQAQTFWHPGVAIDKITAPCREKHCVATSSMFVLRNAPFWDTSFPIKDTACLGGFKESLGKGLCFLEKNTKDALVNFINGLRARGFTNTDLSPTRWRITEAFPPTSRHQFPGCHYKGTCFDFATQYFGLSGSVSGSSADYETFCNRLGAAYEVAKNFFQNVKIESVLPLSDALRYCVANRDRIGGIPLENQISQNENTTGFHLHIQDPK